MTVLREGLPVSGWGCWGSFLKIVQRPSRRPLTSWLFSRVFRVWRPRDQPTPLRYMGKLRPRAGRFQMERSGKKGSLRGQC